MALLRQNTQIYNSNTYDDQTTIPSSGAGSSFELAISSSNLQLDLNNIRTVISHVVSGSNGNFGTEPWYQGLSGRGVNTIDTELADLEARPVACNASVLTDITVPAAQNWIILSVAGNEAPTPVGSLNAATEGVIVAQSALSGAGFDVFELTERANSNDGGAIAPLNLVVVRDAATGQPIQSGGRDVQALIQVESTFVNGSNFNDTSAGNRVKLSFVRVNSAGDDLEAVPVADIENQTFEYNYLFNMFLENLDLQCFVGSRGFVDQAAAVDVTLSNAYANQMGNAALTQNIVSQVDAINRSWSVVDASGNNIASFGVGAAATDVELLLGVPTSSGQAAVTTIDGLDLDINVDNAVTVENGAVFEGATANISVNTAGGGVISSDASLFLTGNTNASLTATTGDVFVTSTAGSMTLSSETGTDVTSDGNIGISANEASSVSVSTQQDPAGVSGDISLITGDGNIGATQTSGDIILTTGDTGIGDVGSIILTGGTSASASTALTGGIFLNPGDNLQNTPATVPRNTLRSSAASNLAVGQSAPVITLDNVTGGTGGGRDADLFVGNIVPTHLAQGGSLFLFSSLGAGGSLYVNTSTGIGPTWSEVLTAGSSGLTLQAAYEGGDPVNPAGNTIVTTGGSALDVSGTEAISLDAGAASNFTVDGAGLTLATTTSGDVAVSSAALVDIDGAGAVSINSSGGAINIGNDADAQNINIGTGAAARVITIGNQTAGTRVDYQAGIDHNFISSVGEVDELLQFTTLGTGGATTQLFTGQNNPDTVVSAPGGSIFLRHPAAADGEAYINVSTGTGVNWEQIVTSGSGLIGLQEAYEAGNTITTSASEGNVVIGGTESFIVQDAVIVDFDTTSAINFSADVDSSFIVDNGTLTLATLEGGNITVQGGSPTTPTANGSNVSLFSGAGNTTGSGGSLVAQAGSGGATGAGGVASLIGGNGGATSGNGGSVGIDGGTAVIGNGGSVIVQGGNVSANGNGGDVVLSPGTAGAGGGSLGLTRLQSAGGTTLGQQQIIVQLENESTGTGGGESFAFYGGTSAPAFSAETGSLFHLDDGTTGALYINDSAAGSGSSWSQLLTSATISLTLQGAYNGGNTIDTAGNQFIEFTGVAAGDGGFTVNMADAITISGTAAANVTLQQNGTGNISLENTGTGNVQIQADNSSVIARAATYAALGSTGDTSGGGVAIVTDGVDEVFTGIGFDGLATNTNSLPIRVQTGETSGTGNSGALTLQSGETVAGQSGAVILASGPGTGGVIANTGSVTVATGAHAANAGLSGALTLATGNSTNASSGDMSISTGTSQGASGDIVIGTGASANASLGATGSVDISTGDATVGNTGPISLSTGDASQAAGGIGLTVGDSVTTGEIINVGRISLLAGDNAGEDRGGDIILNGGDNTNIATGGDGGNIQVIGGDAAVGNGGDITFTPGSGAASNGVTGVTTTFAVTDPVFQYTNGTAGIQRFVSNATPEGAITGNPGDICHVETGIGNGEVYIKESGLNSAFGWSQLATSSSTLTRTYYDGTMDPGSYPPGTVINAGNTTDVVGTFPTNLGTIASEFNERVKVWINGVCLQNSTQAIYNSATGFTLNFEVFPADTVKIEIFA